MMYFQVHLTKETMTSSFVLYNLEYMIDTSLVLITISIKVLNLLDSVALSTGRMK